MEKRILAGAVLITCISFLTPGTGMPAVTGQILHSPSASSARVLQAQPDFSNMPVSLIPNQGQLDDRVDYYIQGKDKTIYFGAEGVTFALTKADEKRISNLLENRKPGERIRPDLMNSLGPLTDRHTGKNSRWVVKLDFVGANPGVKPVGTDKTGTVISYFQGAPGNWKTGISPYSRVIYANLWPGIDLVYTGTMDKLKYEFIVHPGADPARIRLAYRGASSVHINAKGQLVVTTPSGGFEDGAPVAYQENSGNRVNVPLEYEIVNHSVRRTDHGSSGENEGDAITYGFSVGEYDRTQPLVLDPVILIYCGYVGGPNFDYGYGIAASKEGNAYITGYTSSMGSSFPVTVGPDLTFNRGSMDAFVAKLNASGTALDYCGYIGGSGDDYGYGIAVDPSGNAYVTGYTSSTESTFPVAVGPELTQNGLFDVFVARVKANGKALDYCGYIGGSSQDYGRGIAVDGSGNAYVTGSTNSTESTFPVVEGPYLTQSGNFDAFVAKVDSQGTAVLYCGYIGGSGEDVGTGIAVDGSGNAYVTGYTSSSESTFPAIGGPYVTYNGGYYDAFVAKVRDAGSSFDYCGYIGGSAYDVGTGIAVDGRGYAYVTGYTSSKEDSFPVNVGPGLTHSGSFDVYVAKVDSSGSELSYCGYIGGSDADLGLGLALDGDGSGNVYLTGNTYSMESSFPVVGGPDLSQNGSRDAFVAKINEISITVTSPNGGEILYVGLTKNITWLSAGKVGNVKIEYSTDSGTSWMEIVGSTENNGTYSWLVPDEASTTCLVQISEAEDGDPSDTSNAAFTISNAPVIIVTSPNGGESWPVGSAKNITWLSAGGVGNVKIEYSTDYGTTWIEIVASTENNGTYAWIVPDAVSNTCLVRISEAEDGDPSDTNDTVFSITSASIFVANSPNRGESAIR